MNPHGEKECQGKQICFKVINCQQLFCSITWKKKWILKIVFHNKFALQYSPNYIKNMTYSVSYMFQGKLLNQRTVRVQNQVQQIPTFSTTFLVDRNFCLPLWMLLLHKTHLSAQNPVIWRKKNSNDTSCNCSSFFLADKFKCFSNKL